MSNEPSLGALSQEKRAEFKELFLDFRSDYLLTNQGRQHASKYESGRKEALSNLLQIEDASHKGQDITDLVLLKLLPHVDTKGNRAKGAWIHIAPAVTRDVKEWFEGAGWTKSGEWPSVANGIFGLCESCKESPGNLRTACLEFSGLPYSKGFQSGMLSPILNALWPEHNLIINSKSLKVHKFFAARDLSAAIKDYSASNEALKSLINSLSGEINTDGAWGLDAYHVFDMFTHWFVAIRKVLNGELGKTFSVLFSDLDQGVWAFGLLADTLSQLGIEKSDDPRYSVTLRRKKDGYHLHLSFGNWLVLGLIGDQGSLSSLALALLTDGIPVKPLQMDLFSQPTGEAQVQLCSFAFSEVAPLEGKLKEHFGKTLEFLGGRFEKWTACPFRRPQYESLAEAIFDDAKTVRLLHSGFKPVKEDVDDEGTIRYWKIAPGDSAWNWEACLEGNYIAIGWDELGDLSGVDQEGFAIAKAKALKEHPSWKEEGVEQVWRFRSIQVGDKVIANRGTKEVLGFGTVTGAYYFVSGGRHGHRLPVHWDDTVPRKIDEGGWRRTMIELDQEKFRKIMSNGGEKKDDSGKGFTAETFRLLEAIHQTPKQEFYQKHKEEFKANVESPFQQVVARVAQLLPPQILSEMETEKGIFAKIVKNDWGKGGTWDYYWGAFYPKGGKRIQDAQLFMWMNRDRFDFGFFIGEYGSAQKTMFIKALKQNEVKLTEVLAELLGGPNLKFGRWRDFVSLAKGQKLEDEEPNWEEWLHDPEGVGIRVGTGLTRNAVLALPAEDLAKSISETFKRVYPLVILATTDDPISKIGEYIESLSPGEPISDQYTLSQCCSETFMSEETISRWVKAIERKGQAIIYGPPGTGKTFIARKIAHLLTAESDGYVDIVQFHPAFAYEDFVQGIRPRKVDSGLDYPVVPGRFLDFCSRARSRRGTCVLIIDEINRANLARVLGELMYLLEYRDDHVPLAAGGVFSIPANVRIIGTMNTADRSIALVDHALRRRFAFLPLYPNYEILQRYHLETGFNVIGLIDILKKLNAQIADPHYEVGISFFLRRDILDQVEDIWRMEIEPYIEEYFFDQTDKVKQFRWEQVAQNLLI